MRDPRTDPQPGDVIRKDAKNGVPISREVTARNPRTVFWQTHFKHAISEVFAQDIREWRKWAAAAVVERLPKRDG